MTDFEKLGAFYLGKTFGKDHETLSDDVLLYDAKDLTTQALCVGMTYCGETALHFGSAEEAAALQERAPGDFELQEVIIRPRKSDISVTDPMVAWMPWKVDPNGIADPLY